MEKSIIELRNLLNREIAKKEKQERFEYLIDAIEKKEYEFSGALNFGKPNIVAGGNQKRKHDSLIRLKELPEEIQKKIVDIIYEYAKSCVSNDDSELKKNIKKIANSL